MLVVEKLCYERNEMKWYCKCDCGNFTRVTGSALRAGNTRSCGCLAGRPYPKGLRESKPKKESVWNKEQHVFMVRRGK